MEENKKIINNAKAAYGMMFICIAFIFVKNNPLLNNNFVKAHTKTAFVLHLAFLLVYIIFMFFGLGSSIAIFGFGLNYIITTSLFIIILGILLFGVYRANKGEMITIGEILSYKGANKKISINENEISDEKNKLNLILSYIPFLGFIIYARNTTNKTIKDISKINLIVSIIISLLFIFGNNNLGILLILFYIIFCVFINTILVTSNISKTPDLDKIPTIGEFHLLIKIYKKYLTNHLKNKDFKGIKESIETEKQKQFFLEKELMLELSKKPETKISRNLIYIPGVNLIFLFFLKSRYKIHIINSLFITVFIILSILIFGLTNISLLALFPIFYGIGYINRLGYKMPFIYDLYGLLEKIFLSIKNFFSKVKKIKNTEEKINLKVKGPEVINNEIER